MAKQKSSNRLAYLVGALVGVLFSAVVIGAASVAAEVSYLSARVERLEAILNAIGAALGAQ
jgi:hypothetical protein